MKKFYSIVLMATMLLVGTQTWANVIPVGDMTALENAWKTANGDTIQLTTGITLTKELWLGTGSQTDDVTRSITLDLNGKTLQTDDNVSPLYMRNMFVLTRGELNIISTQGEGLIRSKHARNVKSSSKGHQEMIRVSGTTRTDFVTNKVEGETGYTGYFSHLTIGENVTVSADSLVAITVDATEASWPFWKSSDNSVYDYMLDKVVYPTGVGINSIDCPYQTRDQNTHLGSDRANGVRVDIYGTITGKHYAMKVNGYVNYVDTTEAKTSGTVAPYIHLHPTADLSVPANPQPGIADKPVVAYCSGYAHWLIEGKCVGASAIYIKSGDVKIKDAIIESNYGGTYSGPAPTTQGVAGIGSAITVESNKSYAGNIEVEISGDTKVTATNGYAINEAVTNAEGTYVETITVTGGTFEGGKVGTDPKSGDPIQGTIHISTETTSSESSTVAVVGGNVQGEANLGGQTLEQYLAGQSGATTHVTYVENEQGKTVMVISDGGAPHEEDTWADAVTFYNNWSDESSRPSIKIEAAFDEDLPADWNLAELELNEATNVQVLTIPTNKTLKVGRVVLGKKAQIIVNAGGKFIVTGTQGIIAPVTGNIILKTEEGNPSIFVFRPEVTSNRHPKATVEFISKGYKNGSLWGKQRFGIPTFGQLDSIKTKYADVDVQTALSKFDYEQNKWYDFGWINIDGKNENLDQMADAFDYYQMQHNTPNTGTKVTMYGALVGNEIPALNVRENYWNGYANSCMGLMNIPELLDMIPNTVDKAIYLYDIDQIQATWEPITKLDDNASIQPLQPFLIRNTKAAATVTVDYGDAVYYPTTGETKPSAGAPRRRVMSDITKAKLVVNGEGCKDRVIVAEDAEFSAEFDNGYDAAKFMNEGINMYVSANEKMSNYATDNLENTYVGFQTVNGGTYTIEFANVRGEELTLIDLETGARVAMIEGNAYAFTADANYVNDYRFEIVKSAKLPTAINNTEAVKSVKGIYTITGQYVGEMNVWNTLPAGVYVINGEKRVK